MSLSLCMILKNEQQNLSSCLDSVRGLVDEIVAVDTGSTDETPRIAAQHGAKVIPYDFSKIDFAGARNHGLSQASGSWILVLDADETLDRKSWPLIRSLAGAESKTGFYLERHNRHDEASSPKRDHLVRLFPNRPFCRFRGRVHETVDDSILAAGGRLLPTRIRIDHNFATNQAVRRRKNLQYIGILQEEIAANPADTSRLDFLAAEYHQLEMFEDAIATSERIVELRPLDARAHLFLGAYRLLHQNDPQGARAEFMTALRLRPGYEDAESFLQMANQANAMRRAS